MTKRTNSMRRKRIFFVAEATPLNTCICELLAVNALGYISSRRWIPWTKLTRPEWRRGKELVKTAKTTTTCATAGWKLAVDRMPDSRSPKDRRIDQGARGIRRCGRASPRKENLEIGRLHERENDTLELCTKSNCFCLLRIRRTYSFWCDCSGTQSRHTESKHIIGLQSKPARR